MPRWHQTQKHRWLVSPVAFVLALEFVLHHLDWSLPIKFVLLLGVPAASALVVPWTQLKWAVFSLVPLLLVYWLIAGGTTGAASGTHIGESRLVIAIFNLALQTAGLVTGIGLRVILRGVRGDDEWRRGKASLLG
jgi:hypothetical protein